MTRLSLLLASFFLLSCACGSRMEQHSSAAQTPAARQDILAKEAPSGDTARTAVLPPEVYGRYYKLQDVVRQDASFRPIPRPEEANSMWLGGNPYDRNYAPKLIMFTPGVSHVDYVLPEFHRRGDIFAELPPIHSAYYDKASRYRFLISDTTYIHPADSIITASLRTWNEGQKWHERLSKFRLLHADSSRLVIRVEYIRPDSIPRYEKPNYEEMYYRYVPQDSVFAGRTAMVFPSHEAVDDYLVPTEGLSLRELGERRYPPMIIRPDTLRVGAEGGTFPVESSLALNVMNYSADERTPWMYGVLSYDGSAETDTVSFHQIRRGECWVRCRNMGSTSYPVVVLPNEDPRPRRACITIQGDTNLPFMYRCIGRTPPSGTLVILQEGAKK